MLSKKYLNLWLLKIESIEKIGHVHNLFMYDYNEDLSVVSRTTLNERQVHLCQVYVARIIGGWGGGYYLQNSKIFFPNLGSFLNQSGQFAFQGNCVEDSTLEFFPPLKQNIK